MNPILWSDPDSFPHNHADSELTSYRSCPVCGADHPQLILNIDDFQFFTDSSTLPKRTAIREVQCSVCRGLYLNPAYTSRGFEVLFAESGCSYGSTAGRPQEQISWLTDHGLLNARGSILDVGCYDGRFLSLLPANVRRLGVDIDKPAIERGRSLYGSKGIELIHGDFDHFKFDGHTDTFTLFHVLEHLPDPVATLRNLRNQAHEKSVLVVEVPILENGFTNDINSFFSAQHMTHFSRTSLKNTLARAGWEIIKYIEQPDYNGYRVLAIPTVPTQETTPGFGDDIILQRILEHRLNAIALVQSKLTAIYGAEKVVIWGGGMHTEFLYQVTDFFKKKMRQYIIIDSDPIKQHGSWRGIPICSPNILQGLDWKDVWLIPSSYAGTEGITKAALDNGVPDDRIVTLYDQFRVY